jgi:two-component system LytT family response regulator
VLVADGEAACRTAIESLLAAQAGVEIVASTADVATARSAIAAQRPDLVVAGSGLPGGGGGCLAPHGGLGLPLLVLVSDDPADAAGAYAVGAADHLVWPPEESRFAAMYERCAHRIGLERLSGLRAQLLDALGAAVPARLVDEPPGAEGPSERIAVEHRGRIRVVAVSEIDYVTSSGPYAELHVGDRRHVIRASMRDLERRLDPARFQRIHRSIIVRLDQVDSLIKGRGGEYEVVLRGGMRLRVSRARREALERRLGVLPG